MKELQFDVNLQTDVTPSITASSDKTKAKDQDKDKMKEDDTVSKRAEVFVRAKFPLQSWDEKYIPRLPQGFQDDEDTQEAPKDRSAAKLPRSSLLTSSNNLLADYQSNVLSIYNNSKHNGEKSFHEQATAHHYVVGWYSEPQND